MGLNYGRFAVVLSVIVIVVSCLVGIHLNRSDRSTITARRPEEDDSYALNRIGKDSVYSYFVTEKPLGWITAFATLGIQVFILVFFIMASEANLQDDKIDIQFTWKCPRDSDECDNKADLTNAGWGCFVLLMIAFLAKDFINGAKLLYHSSRSRHALGSRIRYFIGGMSLFSITGFALYVSCDHISTVCPSFSLIRFFMLDFLTCASVSDPSLSG